MSEIISEISEESSEEFTGVYNHNAASVAAYCRFIGDASQAIKDAATEEFTIAVFAMKNYIHICETYGLNEEYHLNNKINEVMTASLSDNEYFSNYEIHKYVMLLRGDQASSVKRITESFCLISDIAANDKCHLKVCFACGTYSFSGNDEAIYDIIDKAGHALSCGKMLTSYTEIIPYTEDIGVKENRKKTIERDLHKAVENNELIIEIQPKYNLKTGDCVSAEALVRWEHPELGRISPDEFIPFSEQTGDVIDIDMFVLETVCKNMRRWLDMGVNPVPVAVNQSRMHIADPSYVDSVFRMMQKYDVWPSLIELETTESITFNDYDSVSEILRKLHDYGFVLSMDDFGSGFTSIYMISELDYDVLKLDQRLISSIGNPRTATLLRHIISMAHDLHMTVVAEGVETHEQAEAFRNLGCDLAQGFYFSHPVSVDKFDAKIFGIVTQ